ncbi:MAG: hypothetical protein KGJ19_06600 [Betaproteobacteria bacterium]|nr:hypothetical protein [Betaproteobacteria bacterium]MDE2311158.1 hypothetical protein [Betaproteobacteria bacterium]
MIRNPIDIASRTSPELSILIESIVNQLDSDEPVTLATVRSFIEHELPAELSEDEHLHHFDTFESLIDELDALIEGFGESAAAIDFVSIYASEPLSRAIEIIVSDENRENPPTLATIRDALASGLSARLIGDGVLEEDEADMLMPEIEELIDRFGDEALAEEFLRYE